MSIPRVNQRRSRQSLELFGGRLGEAVEKMKGEEEKRKTSRRAMTEANGGSNKIMPRWSDARPEIARKRAAYQAGKSGDDPKLRCVLLRIPPCPIHQSRCQPPGFMGHHLWDGRAEVGSSVDISSDLGGNMTRVFTPHRGISLFGHSSSQ
jgi:hypothetical protein